MCNGFSLICTFYVIFTYYLLDANQASWKVPRENQMLLSASVLGLALRETFAENGFEPWKTLDILINIFFLFF